MRLLVLYCATLASYAAAPCITATPACTEWVTVGGGPWRSMIYRTHSLDVRDENITRALIVVHGTNRDADHYFMTALAAAFLARALDDTAVIVPRIASNNGGCRDALAPDETSYSCAGNSWKSGGISASSDRITSFDFMDDLMRKLAKKQAFPNLKRIVLAGHSAGGQFVTRYEMSNKVHETLGVPISYIVSNPSSYAYPDGSRPQGNKVVTFHKFADAAKCTGYNDWPYGLENRTGYASRSSEAELKKQLASRPVVYLLGETDILPLGGFDSTCPAMAQGPTRLARGQAYARMVAEKLGAKHQIVVVPLCGHNARCMFTSDTALPLLFPK